MPVLPPTEESTCARSEVGIWTKSMPRRAIDAAKPARSPITPPPSARMMSPRSSFASRMPATTVSRWANDFVASPAGTMISACFSPAASSDAHEPRQLRLGDRCVGDDAVATSREHRVQPLAGALQHVAADDDVVGPLAERDVDGSAPQPWAASRSGWRCAISASIASLATTSCGTSRLSTAHVGFGVDRVAHVDQGLAAFRADWRS